jgi:hypothetical protein
MQLVGLFFTLRKLLFPFPVVFSSLPARFLHDIEDNRKTEEKVQILKRFKKFYFKKLPPYVYPGGIRSHDP